MSAWVQWAITMHRAMLACYPRSFREEFGGEMQEVFASALREARQAGEERPWRLCWREMRAWPGSVLGEHLRERRYKMSSPGFLEEKPRSRREQLVGLALFAVPLLGVLGAAGILLPEWLDHSLLIVCAGAVFFVLAWALVKGFPLGSLPYLGLVLLLGTVLLRGDDTWGWIYPLFLERFGPRSMWPIPVRILYVAAFEFIVLFTFLLGALILVNLLRLLPPTRGLWQRIRADWTQLSFLLYGGLVFNLWILFEEYQHDELWQLMGGIALGLGAWWFLRARGQKERILALIAGATGTMWIVALAKWVLVPLQSWPDGYPVSPSEVTRWVETGSAITGWACILLLLFAPALLGLLPRAPDPALSPEGDPVAASTLRPSESP